MSGELRKIELEDYVREWSVRMVERYGSGIVPDAETARFIEEISSCLGWPEVIFVADEIDPEPPRYASSEAERQALLAARDSAGACLDVLRVMAADGDENATAELVHLLADNIAWLEGYSYREKGNLKDIAPTYGVWPVMLNRRPGRLRQATAYLERIGLNPKPDARFDWQQPASTDAAPLQFATPAEIQSALRNRTLLDFSYSASHHSRQFRVHIAAGNRLATCWLVELLSEFAYWLETYSHQDKGSLKTVAALAPVWPVMLARGSQRTEAVLDYLTRIGLGSKAQISSSPKWGTSWHNEGAVATHYARAVRQVVGNARNFFRSYDGKLETNGPLSRAVWQKIPQWVKDAGKLPPLTKQSAPDWLKIGWPLLLEKHNGHPENDTRLSGLAEQTRAGKYARAYKNIAGAFASKEVLERKESPQDTAAADIRARIKERILTALTSLAPVA